MDITILLALQDFRNGVGAVFAEFLNKMTFYGEANTVLIIMAIMYWCVNKAWGTYLLMGWNGNRMVNGALKVTACVYRPWIRDPRIVPYGDSMTTATGYSFPSGHTANASSVFGGGVVRKDFPTAFRVLLFIILGLVGFSRLFLGVHTPQDVLVGAAIGLTIMWLTLKLMNWIEAHPEKDLLVMGIGIGLAAALAVYAAVKPYPEDYNAEGQLIVDGAKMAVDTFKMVGWCPAFLIGWILERRFVKFTTEVPIRQKIQRCVSGLLIYYAIRLIIMPLITAGFKGMAGTVISSFLQMFFVIFLFPWCLKHIEKEA